jgi:hypothetical protein
LLIGIFVCFKEQKQEDIIFCTEEAKLCPDGSYVSREGPNCEFAKCPVKNFIDNEKGIYFEYPEKLYTQYIRVIDWPPLVNIIEQEFSCIEAGSEIERSGKTEKIIIDGQEYCVTKASEGAAGSVYTQYAYAYPKNNKTIVFTFSLKFIQCYNYDELEKSLCEEERNNFDINPIINDIIKSAVIKE